MPDPSDSEVPAATGRDARRPETDPGAAPPERRAYEDLPARGTRQGPLSPGASEPGAMGEPGGDAREERPREHPRDDGTGYRG